MKKLSGFREQFPIDLVISAQRNFLHQLGSIFGTFSVEGREKKEYRLIDIGQIVEVGVLTQLFYSLWKYEFTPQGKKLLLQSVLIDPLFCSGS